MAGTVAVNVTLKSGPLNSNMLMNWLNETLQTDFTKVEQICTGRSALMYVLNVWMKPTVNYELCCYSEYLCILWICRGRAELSCSCLAPLCCILSISLVSRFIKTMQFAMVGFTLKILCTWDEGVDNKRNCFTVSVKRTNKNIGLYINKKQNKWQ